MPCPKSQHGAKTDDEIVCVNRSLGLSGQLELPLFKPTRNLIGASLDNQTTGEQQVSNHQVSML
jgi:hypothetical protein